MGMNRAHIFFATALLVAALSFGPRTLAADELMAPVGPDADTTIRQITQALHKARPGERLDYSNHDLTYLDFSGIDFKAAILKNSDLYGADFTGANLKGSDLSGTRLDRAVLIKTDLSGADLTGATILRPTVFTDLSNNATESPKFSGANLRRIRVSIYFSGTDFRGADLTEANFSPLEFKPGQGTMVTPMNNFCRSCDFSGATLKSANFFRLDMMFSQLTGADLTGANLSEADLSKVDFSGANLAGVNFTGADLDGAILSGVKGLDTAIGLDKARNVDRATR
jgi:uncharacterized protein YjbI with pentapeptide repeats